MSARHAAILLVVAASSAFAVPPAAAIFQSQTAVELTSRGVELIADQRYEEALEVLQQAIEEDEEHWESWYQRGRALALSGRTEEAKRSLLQSTVLNPGHANAHQLTALAARRTQDYELAWDQAIRAYLSGADEQQVFGGLSGESEPPLDFDERINAWRVHVVGVDTAELIAQFNSPRGGGASVLQALGEIQADLIRLQKHVANAISDARGFGLVIRPELAQYLVVIVPDTVASVPRPAMVGRLNVYSVEPREQVYVRRVNFRDLTAAGQVEATLQQWINNLEAWRAESMR